MSDADCTPGREPRSVAASSTKGRVGSGPPSNTQFPGPTRVRNPNGTSIGSAVFAGVTIA